MDEATLRTEYWVDNRSRRDFPLWVIFRQIGQQAGLHEGHPYLRRSGMPLADLVKRLEAHPAVPQIASDLGCEEQELRATLWYLTWLLESLPTPEAWDQWNRRLDEAWREGVLGAP